MSDEAIVRRDKLRAIQEEGVNAYPSVARRTATCAQVLSHFEEWEGSGREITLSGRLLTTRLHGALMFADLRDGSEKIQIVLKEDIVGERAFKLFHDTIDPADIIEAIGTLFKTKRGEKSLQVTSWRLLSKALLPLPEKWHGLADPELRYRYRELDLLSNPEVRRAFKIRTRVISSLRRVLEEEGFEEVETPILQAIPGGATARPFVTHHNALDIDLYLRIAPELYLKRLIVGGYEKVYEIGRQFRNEGIDWSHNPEFTSLEFYWAYQDYRGLIDFTEKMLKRVIEEAIGTLEVTHGERAIDFSKPWPRTTFRAVIKQACGIDIEDMARGELVKAMKKLGVESNYKDGHLGKLYDDLYKDVVRNRQIEPAFVFDYPVEMEPLAKKCEDNPRYVQRFQLIAGGAELLKAYSELNDPIDQLARFEAQQKLREEGDEEAQRIDMTFIKSLEHGLPPTAGWGMGIDRFVALLAGARSVKEVILFPTLRPQPEE